MIEIRTVEKDSRLLQETIEFVENCSWEDAKEHIAYMLKNWGFTDWETMLAACRGNKVVGIASVMKTDYYPLPDVFPWVSSVFVDERERGHRISEKLIGFANQYLKENGFERSYIPSEYIGLYEKYGYSYERDIVNYGGGVDHLFVRQL